MIEFATGYLNADYIFWCTEEPYSSNDVVKIYARCAKLTKRCCRECVVRAKLSRR